NESRSHRRQLASLTTAAALLLGLPGAVRADDSLAQFVPAEVGLFVEVRGAGDLLTALTEPQVWTTLAELAGQPAQPEDVDKWRRRIRRAVKMNPDEAIRVLFSRGVAFVGEGPGRSQDAVVLCRPAQNVSTEELLKRWGAQRLPQPPRPPTYRLYSNIGVAEHKGLFFFGDLLPPEGFFQRMQHFAADARSQSLADDPIYKKLLARVPERPDGVLFARLTQASLPTVPGVPPGTQPSTQPALRPALPDLRAPFLNAENVLLALHRDGPLLHFTAVGDATGNNRPTPAGAAQLVEKLPARTLLAWEGRVDYSELAETLKQVPEQNPIRTVFQLQEQIESLDRFVQALGGDTCLAVGPVFPAQRSPGAPPLPAAALLIGTRDPAVAGSEVRNVVNAGIAAYSVFAFTRGLPLLLPIRESRLSDTPAFVLDLSPLLKPTARAAIGEVHLCWAMHDHVLIIASHLDWLRQIIAAREGAANLSKVVELSRARPTSSSTNAIVIQSGPISDIGALWLKYLRRTKPEVFDERWWRSRQPGGGDVRLGINVTPDPANQRLRIEQVFENQPAYGRLKPGDFIVGYDNRRFATDDLISEIRTAIQERPNARWMELLIERKGPARQMRLPLPFIDPVQVLKRVIAIGKIAQRSVYHDDYVDAAGPRGFLTIELRTSEKPLFQFSAPTSGPSRSTTRHPSGNVD
ncbi:MAG: hypothetical protein ACE5I3_15455, partial [Phycisphaerae bacterium]